MSNQTTTTSIPEIMTANTYYWRPGYHASERRSNEQRNIAVVEAFLAANAEKLAAAGIVINFSYSESCNNVYKRCEITRNGKRSNITAVRKALAIQ